MGARSSTSRSRKAATGSSGGGARNSASRWTGWRGSPMAPCGSATCRPGAIAPSHPMKRRHSTRRSGSIRTRIDSRSVTMAEQAAQDTGFERVVTEVSKRIVGQDAMVERLLIGLLTGGHILLEGVPGLAKTLSVRTLAEIINATFSRIQFTPDLLPADVIGTMVFDQKTQEFHVKKGPLFAHIILADEINRAPAKVQAALLEAMQEQQVTIGGTTFELEEPFLVLATQNPIENEGTYPLPEIGRAHV